MSNSSKVLLIVLAVVVVGVLILLVIHHEKVSKLTLSTINNQTSTAAIQTASCSSSVAQYDSAIPSSWQSNYTAMSGFLDNFDNNLSPQAASHHVTYGIQLNLADGDLGTKVYSAANEANITTMLNAYKSTGVTGVTIKIPYPILTPNYPNFSSYLSFYENVVQEAHNDGMTVDIESAIIQATTAEKASLFKNLTLAAFISSEQQVTQLEINDLHPDIIDIGAEPDTHAWQTDLSQLNTPSGWWTFLSGVLTGLNKDGTKIAVGGAAWDSPDFITQAVADPRVDDIAIHLYPLYGDSLNNMIQEGKLADQNGKQIIIDDFWDLKSTSQDPNAFGNLASGLSLANLGADRYSFWIPLDMKFLSEIAKFSNDYNVAYVSPYWSDYLFAYLNYSPSDSGSTALGYAELVSLENAAANNNVASGTVSQIGCYYKELSTGAVQ